MLPQGLTADALEAAEAETDPESLAAATRLRARFGPELAAAALRQVSLRRRAEKKFGARAAELFFTPDGLEQATRPQVAARHAQRFQAAGVRTVVDLGCGIGSDALAFAEAGLQVTAVDQDPRIVEIARANLPAGVEVQLTEAAAYLAASDAASGRERIGWFVDPSRRDAAGRIWRVSDFSPPWSVVLDLLDGRAVTGVKLGPALPHRLIPPRVEAEWVSHAGSTTEVGLWAGPGATPDARRATILSASGAQLGSLVVSGAQPAVATAPVRRYLYEPDGAVLRAGAIPMLAERLGATLIESTIAYLSAETLLPTPYAEAFEILEVLPYRIPAIRSWLRAHGIGALEIKQRGISGDPAELRRKLRPRGTRAATLIISRTPGGASVFHVRRATGR